MKIDAPFLRSPGCRAVIATLSDAGFRALPVGGCVRNAIMGVAIADVDIATDAHPDRVAALGEAAGLRAVPTGINHGTVTLVAYGEPFEVTTFRRDVTTDGRRAVVAFSDDIRDDAMRRDFTMNALYLDGEGTVIDPIGGLDDLRARHLRFVGDAAARIHEDYLRILRFFRFLAWYGRSHDPAALAACAALAGGLAGISRERIGHEMRRLLAAPDPAPAVALMADAGVLAQVLPGADAGALAALVGLDRATPDWPRRLAALGADSPRAALRLSRAEARVQAALREALTQGWSPTRTAHLMGAEAGRDVALITAARGGAALAPGWQAAIARAAGATLPISAADLPELRGPAMGRALNAARNHWIGSDFTAPRAALMATARASA